MLLYDLIKLALLLFETTQLELELKIVSLDVLQFRLKELKVHRSLVQGTQLLFLGLTEFEQLILQEESQIWIQWPHHIPVEGIESRVDDGTLGSHVGVLSLHHHKQLLTVASAQCLHLGRLLLLLLLQVQLGLESRFLNLFDDPAVVSIPSRQSPAIGYPGRWL